MKKSILLITLLTLFSPPIMSFVHNNYAVKKENSPIPYKNDYSGTYKDEYEFYSNLYVSKPDKIQSSRVKITHLSDVDNIEKNTPKSTWRKSKLTFIFKKGSGIELVQGSVVLEHYSVDGELYKPSKTESTLDTCTIDTNCHATLILHYKKGLAEKLIEKIRFKLIIDGEEKTISYDIPLEYKFHYSAWDQLMGI